MSNLCYRHNYRRYNNNNNNNNNNKFISYGANSTSKALYKSTATTTTGSTYPFRPISVVIAILPCINGTERSTHVVFVTHSSFIVTIFRPVTARSVDNTHIRAASSLQLLLLFYLFIMRPSSLGGGRILRRTLSVCPSVRPSRYRCHG